MLPSLYVNLEGRGRLSLLVESNDRQDSNVNADHSRSSGHMRAKQVKVWSTSGTRVCSKPRRLRACEDLMLSPDPAMVIFHNGTV